MSGQVASTLGAIDQDTSQLDEPVVKQQPSVEQPQQEQPPTEIQDTTPGKEEVNGEDPVNHSEVMEKDPLGDSGLETSLLELAEAKRLGEGGDGPDVKEEIASNREPVEMPERDSGLEADLLELAEAKPWGEGRDGPDVKEEIASNREPVEVPEAGRNMSGQVASTLGPRDQDSSQLDEPVVKQQPSVEQPQQEQPAAAVQDIIPGKEEVSVEDPGSHDEGKEKDPLADTGLDTDIQEEFTLAKTGGKAGDGPDVEEIASNSEPVGLPEAGEGQSFS